MHPLPAIVCGGLGLLAGPVSARVVVRFPPRPAPTEPAAEPIPEPLPEPAAEPTVPVHPPTVRLAVVLGLLTGALLAGVGGRFGWRAEVVAYAVLGAAGVVLAAVDVRARRLPDALVLPTYGTGLLCFGAIAIGHGDGADLLRAVVAGAAVFAVFLAATLAGGIGFGDTKLLGSLALHLGWLGWTALARGLLAGLVLGAAQAAVLLVAGRAGWRSHLPFGPALLAGAYVAILLAA